MTEYGSDAIVDLLGAAGIDQVALNPGATFRGIQDSIVQRDDGPSLALCMHESVAVAVAHGYAKAAGRPMAALLHNVVGLQNASMAIYNAWCDRAPILLIGGTGPKSKKQRRPWIDWIHTANSQGEIVRDYVKWDDEPSDMASVPESFARAITAMTSDPTGPVYLCYDISIQEDELPEPLDTTLARYPVPAAPAPREEELRRILTILGEARAPLILAGYCDSEATAMDELGRLAEALGAPVLDTGVRLALATDHPMNGTGMSDLLAEADVVLALDVDNLALQLGQRFHSPDVTVLAAGLGHLRLRGWSHDYQELTRAEVQVTASATETVSGLLRLARPVQTRRHWFEEIAPRIATARAERKQTARVATGPEGTVALERLVFEVGEALGDHPFVLANGTNQKFELGQWTLDQPRQYLGWHGGGGLGYGVGAAIGAALAQPEGTITIDIQADGDLLFLPSALWTAAHLGLGILFVVHDNRQYGNTVEHAKEIAAYRGRDTERRYVGAGLADPPVDLVQMASAYGVWAAGPVTDAEKLPDTLAEAIAVAATGRPALVDVITPGF